MRTIRVTGKGSLKAHPDRTRITVWQEGIYKDYASALKMSALDSEQLRDLLVPFGFARTDLKTVSFDVDTEYESYREKGEYKRRFAGYKYSHTLKLEFDSDNKRLGKILYALSACGLCPEFKISYTVKDPEKVKNELLGNAVRDAAEKAGVLSTAAGLTLGQIQSLDYSWGTLEFEVNTIERRMMCEPTCAEESLPMDIEPDDIDVQDTVTVVWEIV